MMAATVHVMRAALSLSLSNEFSEASERCG